MMEAILELADQFSSFKVTSDLRYLKDGETLIAMAAPDSYMARIFTAKELQEAYSMLGRRLSEMAKQEETGKMSKKEQKVSAEYMDIDARR